MIRQPAVAGQFYTADTQKLRLELKNLVTSVTPKEKVAGIIAPHAGYVYSGAVAGAVYGRIEIPQNVIVLGPNHHGIGSRAALYPEGEWLTPLGTVSINRTLAELIKKHSSHVEDDFAAHHYEHSLEVQVPFLQYLRPDVTIVPLCLGFNDFPGCSIIGKGIALAIKEFGREVLIVASSDMTHYESADEAKKKDDLAIGEVLALNPAGLIKVCRDRNITMCGVIPAATMLVAAMELGAKQARLIRYATSGDVTGDRRQVVAYAALTIF